MQTRKKPAHGGAYDSVDGKDRFGNATESDRGGDASHDLEQVFTDELEVLEEAHLRDAHARKLPRTLPAGTRVRFHRVGNSQARISTVDATPAITEADDLWLACTAVGGRGRADVPLGGADAADRARADQLTAELPPGRTPGASPHAWKFNSHFHPSVDGVALDGGLLAKIHRLIEWAIHNDMVTGDIVFSWGVRSPKDAHKFNVAYEIMQGHVSLHDLQALKGGKDHDHNVWYHPGETLADVQARVAARGLGKHPAASGYPLGHEWRAPARNGKMGISAHCSGRAVDVHIPWRSRDGKGQDVWAWEEIYHQFGLTRPLHRDRGGKQKPEEWHIEETGKELDTAGDLPDLSLDLPW
ncbi:MAG TPA: hypothetical protein VHE35_15025 [Kofleriaceae bacterium]|nr:hypothetical protein [Kofleriaceae bacterium]